MVAPFLVLQSIRGDDCLLGVFNSYLHTIPQDLASDGHLFAEELPNPKRLRFHLERPAQVGSDDDAQRVHAAHSRFANMMNNMGDIANLAEIQCLKGPWSWALIAGSRIVVQLDV